jgi:hypothetical protein
MSSILARQTLGDPNDTTLNNDNDIPFWWTEVRYTQDQCRLVTNSSIDGPDCEMGDLLGDTLPRLCLPIYWILPCEKTDQQRSSAAKISSSKSSPLDRGYI